MKISVLYMGSLKQLNGASSVVRTFDENKNVFLEEGIDFGQMFSYDCVDPTSYKETRKTDIASTGFNSNGGFKQKLVKVLQNSYLGSCFSINWLHIRRAGNLVEHYLKTKMDEDVLIIHDIFTCYEYLRRTNKRKKIILVNHNSGDDWKSFRLYYPKIVGTSFYRKLEKIADYCYSNVEAVVFVSNVSAETFLELEGGKYKDKIHVIHNGISDTATPPERDYSEIKFVTVGTVNERKNQLNLIKCIHKVADDRIHLTVVGDGSMLNDCKAYVEENNIGDQIHLLGKRTDVGDILLQNNVFIMASLGEGLPIAAIEAMRCGLPLVLTDVGGCRELIDGNGLITQSDNDSLEIAIREVSKDTGILREYAKKSRELFVKCFDSRSMITNYCDLAKELNRA